MLLISKIFEKCTTEFDHLETKALIDGGIIILNNGIIDGNIIQSVQGTNLILFNNEVTINSTKYVNRNGEEIIRKADDGLHLTEGEVNTRL